MPCASPSGCSQVPTTSPSPIRPMRATRPLDSRNSSGADHLPECFPSSTALAPPWAVTIRGGTGIQRSHFSTQHYRRRYETHRRLSRLVRSDHQGPRGPDSPLARVRGSINRGRGRQRRETAAVLARGTRRADPADGARPADRRAVVRRITRRVRQKGRCRGDRARAQGGLGLRIRVPDGADEPQSRARHRDCVSRAGVRSHLSQLEPRARGRALWGRCVAAGRSGRPAGAQAQVRRMTFLDRVYQRARDARQRVIFPEGDDPRVQEAARRVEREGLAIVEVLKRFPDSRTPFLARHLRSRRPDRFPTDASAAEALEHPLTRGACLVGIGAADVMVGGAVYPSADTIRAALWAVGMAPSIATVSGAFYMIKETQVLTFADCAVVPEPTSVQLADIAIASARDRRRIVGDEPVVAFLSYSTRGSAEGPRVERVQAAITQLRGRQPPADFVFDGELQTDAALDAAVG